MRQSLRFIGFFVVLCLAAARLPAAEPDVYDLFFNDATSATLNHLTLNFPQEHVITGADDEDWALFYAFENLPYTVRVEHVGVGLDPELYLYGPGLEAYPFPVDDTPFGSSESFPLDKWPASGWYLVRVRAADIQSGPTSYTLTAKENWGASLGLATITGIKTAQARAEGDKLQLPETIALEDGSTATPLYTQSYLSYPAGTFDSGSLPDLIIGGMGAPINLLALQWVSRWHDRFPHNLTVTWVGMRPLAATSHPLELAIQMRAEVSTAAVTDNAETWPETTYVDVPASAAKSQVRVFRWDSSSETWTLYDASPHVEDIEGGWLVKTQITNLLSVFGETRSDAFAAAAVPNSAVAEWLLYH